MGPPAAGETGGWVVRQWANSERRTALGLRFAHFYGNAWDHLERVLPAFISEAQTNWPPEVNRPHAV